MTDCIPKDSVLAWNEADRLAALYDLAILDTEPEAEFDDLVRLAARACQAPVAAVSFLDEHRQWFKACIGTQVSETSLQDSICKHTIRQSGILVVPDASRDPRFRANRLVTGNMHLRFYAGASVCTPDGIPLGTLCVVDDKPRPEGLTQEQSDTLVTLARLVSSHLRLRRSNKSLVERQREVVGIADALPQMVWTAHADGRHEYRNKRYSEFTGAEPEAINNDGWNSVSHPEDRDHAWTAWRRSVETGQPYEVKYRLRHHTGEYRWVLARALPVYDHTGRIERWFGTCTDIHAWKEAEQSLTENEERYRALLEASSVVVWSATPNGLITHSRGWTELSGQEEADYTGLGWVKKIHPGDRLQTVADWQAALAAGTFYQTEFRVMRTSGDDRWVLASAVPIRNPDGSIREWVGSISDIHDRKLAEEQLRASEERLRLALHAGRMIAWEQDLQTNFVTRSQNSLSLLGIGSSPLSEFLDRVHPDDRSLRGDFLRRIAVAGSTSMEFRYVRPDGKMLWLGSRAEKADSGRVLGVTFDISDRKAAEEEVRRAANHDPLTGLPNRALFHGRLEAALSTARNDGTGVNLLLIDLDDFKDVNDTLGHDAGDALLKETAGRLSAMARECDTVARLGGDEFAMVIVAPLNLEHAERFAQIVLERLRQPFVYRDRTIVNRASIGVAAFPDHHAEPAELMKDADIALYRAKAQGRNQAVTYASVMRREIENRVALGRDLREALSNGGIVPYYQPKICLSTGRVTGLEALARWSHPERGILTPAVFGAAFDDHELATTIGGQMMAAVAADLRAWLDHGLDIGRVALNLSSAEFSRASIADDILGTLENLRIPSEHFEIEVTETVLLGKNAEGASAALRRLHESGIRIALDDFGTGYASLTHLKQFPVDHVKIDQSFIRHLERDAGDAAIVAAVVSLGRSLDLLVTAEGVETAGQAMRLRELGCHDAQGYAYAKPMAGSEVMGFLTARNRAPEKAGAVPVPPLSRNRTLGRQ